MESAKRLGYDSEGYIITDGFFNRVKVKSPLYVALSNMIQGAAGYGSIIEIIKKGEQDEFLIYFPEYSDVFNEMNRKINAFADRQDIIFDDIKSRPFESRKALAEVVTKTECPPCLFALFDKKAVDAKSWLMSRPSDKILQLIGVGAD